MAILGNVKALVQANNNVVLAGTDNKARIYRSVDNGQTWVEVTSLALGADTGSVNALVKTNDGKIFAAVTGSTNTQGIWRNDSGDGVGWTRVKTHPLWNNYGYFDITAIQGNRLVAVGYATNNSADGPVIISNDGGNTWVSPFQPHPNYNFIAVAAAPDLVLPTNYAGDSFTLVPAFYGSDSYYTVAGRAGYGASGYQAATTASGAMGNGGLDMAAFLVKNGAAYNVRGLWAVKSHLNVNNTELWQFPASPTGPFVFSKIATIVGELFTSLYVDPAATWQDIGAQRTIWAGGNGRIYVSYNSGLTWAVATEAPASYIYSFVRTTSGVLIAGGTSGEIILFGSGSGSEGGGGGGTPPVEPPPTTPDPPVDPTPPPEAASSVTTRFLGRGATCDEEVFAANKFSFSNVTHIFHYNGASYVNLQFGAEPPYSLLGATPAVNRAVYFGSRTSDVNVPGGPFAGLVFNIGYAAANVTVVWEYWNGSAWVALTVQDNTSGFTLTGTRSVQWQPPALWATVAINGVTGYWVRARVSAVASGPVGPVQSSRYIYTPNLPYVEIAANAISGTLPALAQILWRNQGDNPNGAPDMKTHRLLVGLRSIGDAPGFDAFVNLSDKQAPFGVTISSQNADGAFENSISAPTGRRYTVSYVNGADLNVWQDLVRVAFATTVAQAYYGDFRVFLRGYISSGDANDWKFRLALGVGSAGYASYSREVAGSPVVMDHRLWDLGSLHLPSAALGMNQLSDELTLTVQGYATATGHAAKLYDLILLPTDEWAGDFVHTNLTNAALLSGVHGGGVLDIDSVSNPKIPLSAYNRLGSGLIKAIYQPIANGEAMLQVKQAQRLWMLAAQYDFATSSWASFPYVAGTVRVNKVQQYQALRGAE